MQAVTESTNKLDNNLLIQTWGNYSQAKYKQNLCLNMMQEVVHQDIFSKLDCCCAFMFG